MTEVQGNKTYEQVATSKTLMQNFNFFCISYFLNLSCYRDITQRGLHGDGDQVTLTQ